MTSTLSVRRAEAIETHDIHAAVLRPAFPDTELESADDLASRVAAGTAELWHVDDESGAPVGAAVTERLVPTESVLLTYFAVRADRRSAGIGGRMLDAMITAVVEHHHPTMIIGEVEHPDHHADHPAYGRPGARLRFYARHGARVIDTGYFQPSLGPGLAPVYAMLLIALWVRPDLVAAHRMVPAAGLAATLSAMMPEAQVDPATDLEVVRTIIERAGAPAGVALLGADDHREVEVVLAPDQR